MTSVPKHSILGFRRAASPVRALVTKFGGQPVWNGPPTWPHHAGSGGPMEFVGQVWLDPALFDVEQTTMVYLFVADAVEALTYEPFGGENAVVVQPGDPPEVDTVPLSEGPALHRLASDLGAPVPVPPAECEFEVDVLRDIDGYEPDEEQRRRWSLDPWAEYVDRLQGLFGTTRGNKIGGRPHFHRGAFLRRRLEARPPDRQGPCRSS